MSWRPNINEFKSYLQIERSLSENSIEAYLRDIEKLTQFLEVRQYELKPQDITLQHLEEFLAWLHDFNVENTTQARIISGIRAFYKFLLIENRIDTDPTELLEGPKLRRKLPDTLNYDEITQLISAIDVSTPEGTRNKAMLETLYSCGLRVSELVNLKISNLFLDIEFIKVVGKGDKERLVPIGSDAIKYISIYKDEVRNHQSVKPGQEDNLFLNRRGNKLSREMIFMIIKALAQQAGIKKKVSPHTFRHSFASHMVDRGADLRAVQQMLGHESITTTEIYTHLDRDYLRDTIKRFHPRSR